MSRTNRLEKPITTQSLCVQEVQEAFIFRAYYDAVPETKDNGAKVRIAIKDHFMISNRIEAIILD